jgi:prophage regulatory protein
MILGMEQLVGAAEIGQLLGVSRQRVYQLTSSSDFPEPVATLAMGKVWQTADVRRWATQHGRVLHEDAAEREEARSPGEGGSGPGPTRSSGRP